MADRRIGPAVLVVRVPGGELMLILSVLVVCWVICFFALLSVPFPRKWSVIGLFIAFTFFIAADLLLLEELAP